MKILYAAGLSPNDSSLYRLWALERLGHTVTPFNFFDYLPSSRLALKLVIRLAAGGPVDRFNRDLIALAEREKPDLLWADKMLWMRPGTLDRMRELSIGTVSYMIDNPFGPRQDLAELARAFRTFAHERPVGYRLIFDWGPDTAKPDQVMEVIAERLGTRKS